MSLADPEPEEGPSQALVGVILVLSGGLESMTRAAAKAAVEERGGKVTSSISKKTTALGSRGVARVQAGQGAVARNPGHRRSRTPSRAGGRPGNPHLRFVVCGLWFVVRGSWFVVRGSWFKEYIILAVTTLVYSYICHASHQPLATSPLENPEVPAVLSFVG